MPAKIYLEDALIRMDFSGRFTAEELMAALDEVEKIEQHTRPTPDRIADFTAVVESENRFPQILALVQRRKAVRFPNAFRTAIVAPRPADYGAARSFQMLNDHPQITIQIFTEMAAAKAWLAGK